jgi:hypothetical protein
MKKLNLYFELPRLAGFGIVLLSETPNPSTALILAEALKSQAHDHSSIVTSKSPFTRSHTLLHLDGDILTSAIVSHEDEQYQYRSTCGR